MTTLRLLPHLAVLLLATILPARAAPAETPEAFVRRVYALYRDNGPGVSMERPGGTAFYTSALLDAFAKDSELAHGEVGAIDADPVCDCQAFGKVRVKRVTVTPAAAGSVKARVDVMILGEAETLTLTLSQTPAGWRIADIASKAMPSLKATLDESNAHPIQDAPPPAAKPPPPPKP